MYPEFQDFIVMITGAASGIGLATARQFVEEGATVVAVDIDEPGLDGAAGELGERYLKRTCDMTDAGQVADTAGFIKEKYGRLDVLMNNAAIGKMTAIEAMTEKDYYDHFDINVKGYMLAVTACLPLLRESSYPSILIMSSGAAVIELVNMHFLYSCTKAAVLKYTKHLARDLVGIRANAILPGWVDTPIYERAGFNRDFVEQVYEGVKPFIPAGRIAQPDDIANVILFLSSKKAAYVNGAAIDVDGGYSTSGKWGFPF
jgi:NAD(P)-dependent dehydrogenase (short-subunit alcohol dehydrogenase family)